MTSDPLARPVWSMLRGLQSDISETIGHAVRVDPRYGPFAAATDTSDEAQADLAAIAHNSPHPIWIVEPEAWPIPKGLKLVRSAPLLQMAAHRPQLPDIDAASMVELSDPDVPEMTKLALATEPGPWGERTHTYGQFFGIRDGGKLAAMAGERMRPAPGFAEVSGVCTWPEYRGQGMARRLIARVMSAQIARGDTPFLHSYAGNIGAINLYKSLGFEPTREMVVTVLAPE